MENLEDQVIDVDYDEDLVREYKDNYIIEEEGIGAEEDTEPYDLQTKVNTDTFEDMINLEEVEMFLMDDELSNF